MNQRIIKFRAICKGESILREVWGIDYLNLNVLVDISGSYEWYTYKILEQFTGLKDKNGKEIYEGDIVAMKSTGARTKHEVKFRNGAFEVSLIPCRSAFVRTDPEVIGNIHENPELLNA